MAQQSKTKYQLFSKPTARWAIAVAAVGVVITGITTVYSLRFARQPPVPVASVSAPPAIEAVTALGRLEPEGEVIQLSGPSSVQGARVAQLLVGQGDQVRAEQVIAVLDNRDRLQAALDRTQKQVKVAQANLARVKAGAQTGTIAAQNASIARLEAELSGEREAQRATLERLQAELNNARIEFRRYEQLARDGAISASELDSRRLLRETAQETLSEAQANRKRTVEVIEAQISEAKATLAEIREVRPVDLQQAEAEVEQALAEVGQAQADLELAYVRSPLAGRVLKINTHAGEMVDEEEGIAELGQTDQMIVVAEVYESDIGKVRLGQRVVITSEGNSFAGELRGSVNKIGLQIGKKDILDTDPAAAVDARVVEVNVRLNEKDSDRVSALTNSKVIVKIFL